MFNIRSDAFDVFQMLADVQFEEQLRRYLREHARGAGAMTDEQLRRMVKAGIARAQGHGFELGPALAAFVAVMFEVAPNFDEHPAVAAILAEKDVPAQERMDRLGRRITDEQWIEAGSNYDLDAW